MSMRRCTSIGLAALLAAGSVWGQTSTVESTPAPARATQPSAIVVLGAGGESTYEETFVKQAALWKDGAVRGGARLVSIGEDAAMADAPNDLTRLKAAIATEPREGTEPLWLILLGHGTFDGKVAKFNLRGPDLTATELALDLQPFTRPLVIVNAASASAPFMNLLKGPDRIVITSTRSGYQQNYARFGLYLAEAIADPKGDLDKDGQTSLLEAYLSAAHSVAEFYKTEARLATEHALLDDTGDGRGTPADWFRGVRAIRRPAEGVALDGTRAHQVHLVPSPAERALSAEVRLRRDELEREISILRESKERMLIDEYYRQLEVKFIELSKLYQGVGQGT
ncbi:MAG TPA: hypothetical protein VGD88_14560 [Opitutaceae bacterium]